MKKKLKLILIISSIIILLTILIVIFLPDNIRFKISYESINQLEYSSGKKIEVNIPWDNKIKYLKGKDIINFFNNKTGIVYFGYNSCPWCRNAAEVLIETSKENDIETIYYIDIHSNNFESIKKELFKLIDPYLRISEETNNKVLAVPDVYFVKDGKVTTHHIGTIDTYRNPYQKMDKNQKEELKEIYKSGIEEIKK